MRSLRTTCGQAVDALRVACGFEHNLYTGTRRSALPVRVQTRFSARFTRVQCAPFPQSFFYDFPLLRRWFSPLSTAPITTTTIYI